MFSDIAAWSQVTYASVHHVAYPQHLNKQRKVAVESRNGTAPSRIRSRFLYLI